ncbi:MAG TPA: glutamine synthetase family protein [Candidatus Sumerlaeota bacterium]|nr:glutamine synthetase family protein [Candidatus Sumerlaeota bacterium]
MGEREKKAEALLKEFKSKKVKFIRLWFTDVLGFLKSFTVTETEFETALYEGMGFDGSSIEGYARIQESDLIALPDLDTFFITPFGGCDDFNVGVFFCDVKNPDGSDYEGCPRYALRRMIKKAKDMGFTHYYTGPELEFFLFENSREPKVLDEGGYFDLTTRDAAYDMRRECALAMESMGMPVEFTHHEVAPSQHEIDMKYQEALRMADQVMACRLTIKEVAMSRKVFATFMPKPLFGQNGSGMHVHQSLFKGNSNAFYDAKDPYHLSKVAKQYMAGILKYSKEIVSVLAQWVNSYKRLVPGYEAPVYISWARRNRSTLIRVPMYKPGKEKATRIELRCPDPACNPYLVFTVMLAAGLKGIEEKLELRAPVEEDIFEMNAAEREKHGIEALPGALNEAIAFTKESELVHDALGEHIFSKFIANKEIEWDRYRVHVSQYEIDKLMPLM